MSNGSSHEKDPKKAQPAGRLSRRDMLLTGTSVLAASGLQPATLIAPAQAQPTTPAAPTGRRPNILVINLSCFAAQHKFDRKIDLVQRRNTEQ